MRDTGWSSWMRTWEAHSRLSRFRRALDSSCATVAGLTRASKLFVALSGGKDGVALAGVCKEAGRADLPLVHVYTELNTPGMEDCAKHTARILGMPYSGIQPDLSPHPDIWHWLRAIHGHILHPGPFEQLCRGISVGNMLVAYTYEQRFDGSISGLRAEESKGRRINRRVRGRVYTHKTDGKMIVQPIVDWSARDVFAFCVSRGLPICDHYRLLYEKYGVSPESPGSRVDCLITSDAVAARGALAYARALYPDLWRQIVLTRPELAIEG